MEPGDVEIPALRGPTRWVPVVVAALVFLLTAVENAWFWLSVAGSSLAGSTTPIDPVLGLFALTAALSPMGAAVLTWKLRARRRPTDAWRRVCAALWAASLVSLLPLVIAAFVPGI